MLSQRVRTFAALAWLFCAGAVIRAQAPRGATLVEPTESRRMALVIGNDAYAAMPLKNAVKDAKAVAAALQRYGFTVDVATDVNFKEINKRIDRFIAALQPGDVALVYYAGHGIQIDNENYLVPVDFSAQDEADAKYELYSASRVVDRLAASAARLRILVLDACRNNPFRSTRSGTRGLAPMETGRGSLIAFATAPNRTADDNPHGSNGLFTSYLLEAMDQPGLTIEQVFSRARQRVDEASHGRQTPWLVSSVIGDFYFRPPATTPGARSEEDTFWDSIVDSTSPAPFQRYLDRYPDGQYARLARLYIKALTVSAPNRETTTSTKAAPPPDTRAHAEDRPSAIPPSLSTAGARSIVPFFLKAQGGRTYVPFLVSAVPDATPPSARIGMYYRVESAAPAPRAAPGTPAKYAYEDFLELNSRGSGAPAEASFTVQAGEYVLTIAFAPIEGTNSRDALRALVARVDRGDPGVVKVPVSVPDFWNGEFSTSTVIIAKAIDPLPKPLTPAEQATRPFALGALEVRPFTGTPSFTTNEEISTFLLIYNASVSKATGKPDVVVDYAFYRRQPDGTEQFFNRTSPQALNASTLPATFDLAAGHQLQSGLAVPLTSFGRGEYRLHITVKDQVAGKTLTRDARFTVN